MQQFDLSLWLQDKSRKVVTRRGNPVRIICTDRKHGEDDLPIVFLEENNGGEFLLTCRNDGRCDNYDTPYDLFFADEEEELTEFEQCLKSGTNIYVEQGRRMEDWDAKEDAKELLDLARKELEATGWKDSMRKYKEAYEQGKQDAGEAKVKELVTEFEKGRKDALKDLPKWKKSTEHKDLEKHIAILEEDKVLLSNYLEEGDYYIELDDLKTLPKEE